jgi:hypothetical protein
VANTINELTALFRRLGAPHPEGWARSQLTEGINELNHYLFLRQAWSMIIQARDMAWIEACLSAAEREPDGSSPGVGHAVKRLIVDGVRYEDLTELVRGMQSELLFASVISLKIRIADEGVEHVGWQLVERDPGYNPTDRPIGGLHESMFETDPAARRNR